MNQKIIVYVVLIATLAFILSLLLSNVTLSHGNTEYKTIIVSSGDTLWQIAKKEARTNKYYENRNIEYIIYDIKKINNLTNSNLIPNQKLEIPKL